MPSLHPSPPSGECLLLDPRPSLAVLVAGPPGTAHTLATALSDNPLRPVTELLSVTAPGSGLSEDPDATVTLSLGRIALERAAVTLFAVPDEERLWFRWEELLCAADAALVVADPHNPASSLATTEYLHRRRIPLAAVINEPGPAWPGTKATVRRALHLNDPRIPLITADITQHGTAMSSLTALVQHAHATAASAEAIAFPQQRS
ncbi:hypothetical protein OG455_37625 [Kitasatospora sp. NBC_01287]|uniref:hypothetical protein n=1 Tax=Kitasatospora sp. NBC_01287 TaxID=2903573 RepID=UPI0022560202|nr:hypothetical protein [Kitasatospora sp. NBC_01287]MCX4751162.1 hypothetical protein [Kitasatospora sp. NBC_01287]